VIELAAALAVAAVAGWLRPRRSTLAVALVPTAMAFAWLYAHEDIPGDPITLIDVAWYAGMSLVVGASFMLATALGIAARKAAHRRDATTLH
jgi:hypothetical protein